MLELFPYFQWRYSVGILFKGIWIYLGHAYFCMAVSEQSKLEARH